MDNPRLIVLLREGRKLSGILNALSDVLEWRVLYTIPAEKIEGMLELAKWWLRWNRETGWGREMGWATGQQLGRAVYRAMIEDEAFRKAVMDRLPSPRKRYAPKAA